MEADRPFQSLFRHPHIQSFNPYSRAVFADLAACHTWGQDLSFHPHSLSRISGSTASSARAGPTVSGGLKPNAKTTGSSFRRQAWPTCTRPCLWKFLKKMTPSAGLPTGQPYSITVRYKKWNVYAKAPFGSPAQVVEYLGRYLPSGRRVHTKSPSPDTGYLK